MKSEYEKPSVSDGTDPAPEEAKETVSEPSLEVPVENILHYFHFPSRDMKEEDRKMYEEMSIREKTLLIDAWAKYVSEKQIKIKGVLESRFTRFYEEFRCIIIPYIASMMSDPNGNKFRAISIALDNNGHWDIAICALSDQFNRKLGRKISRDRLAKFGGFFKRMEHKDIVEKKMHK